MLKVRNHCHVCNCCLVDNISCKICGQPVNQILHNLVSVFHYFLVQKLNSNYFPGWKGCKFIVLLNAVTVMHCTEASVM